MPTPTNPPPAAQPLINPTKCPDCSGTGRVHFESRSNYPGAIHYYDCGRCYGSGELQPSVPVIDTDDEEYWPGE